MRLKKRDIASVLRNVMDYLAASLSLRIFNTFQREKIKVNEYVETDVYQ